MDSQFIHPLKIFDLAKSQGRFVFVSAPMVRYSKLAFRQTVFSFGTDLTFTPMIVAKEFNRNEFARDSDFTVSTRAAAAPQPPTVVQFGASSALELARAASLVAPHASGVDLNCGCPQGWACAEGLGASLMDRREVVREMVLATRGRLREDGWGVGLEGDMEGGKGRSVSVKIRVHKDLRKTMDFIDTVVGSSAESRNIDFLTVHPRTRRTPSTQAIDVEALQILTEKYGSRVPMLVSGDVFTLSSLPFTSPLLPPGTAAQTSPTGTTDPPTALPHIPHLAGLMSARAILANPALYAGAERCPWEAVQRFVNFVVRAPLPLRLVLHHLTEMCAPGMGPDRRPLLSKQERIDLVACRSMCDVIDFLDEKVVDDEGRRGLRRDVPG